MRLAAIHGMAAGYGQWPFGSPLYAMTAAQAVLMAGLLTPEETQQYSMEELREHMQRQREKRAHGSE